MAPRTVSAEDVARILNCLAERLPLTEVMRRTGTSTTTLYKIIEQFPLWGDYLKKDA